MSDRKAFFPLTWRRGLSAVFVGWLLLAASLASAGCVRTLGYVTGHTTMPGTVLHVKADDPIGKVLYSASAEMDFAPNRVGRHFNNFTWVTGVMYALCDNYRQGDQFTWDFGEYAQAVAGLDHVFATNVPGIGVRATIDGSPLPYTETLRPSEIVVYPVPPGHSFRVELVKTGAVVADNAHLSVAIRQWSFHSHTEFHHVNLDATVSAPRASCRSESAQRPIRVVFGRLASKAFSGRGSTAAERHFDIRLRCSGSVALRIRFDAVPDPAQAPGVLQLSASDDSAGGVGIQILDPAHQPVVFGQARSVGEIRDETRAFTYLARYFQTGETVRAGSANGMATFTLEYQ
ncbi:fimbrial protein [Bordetella genomosp. 1]|uniref:Fimbrial-type adhesion domain-containing protein n=1 Tax=Bordetella genomosp. 1 TaxID=1395607 RepID=A0ABX4EVN0_9BORD|nr:fimbrial protein [Bordetella genomosp. 1]OZI58535.1 hypothetical protein CAL27_17730 [Bordetella genomosp. 1]